MEASFWFHVSVLPCYKIIFFYCWTWIWLLFLFIYVFGHFRSKNNTLFWTSACLQEFEISSKHNLDTQINILPLLKVYSCHTLRTHCSCGDGAGWCLLDTLSTDLNDLSEEDDSCYLYTKQNLKAEFLRKKPLHYRDIQWGINNTASLKCNGFFTFLGEKSEVLHFPLYSREW